MAGRFFEDTLPANDSSVGNLQEQRRPRAWLVFSRPMDARVSDLNCRSSGGSLRDLARRGSVVDCMQISATKARYTHVTLLFECGFAFSLSMNDTVQKVRHWCPQSIRETCRIDDLSSNYSFKTYRRLMLTEEQSDRLFKIAQTVMQRSKYPRLAYWTNLFLGYVVSPYVIARYAGSPNHLTCSMFLFQVLRLGNILSKEEREIYSLFDFPLPDDLLRIPTITRLVEDTPDTVADYIESSQAFTPTVVARRDAPGQPGALQDAQSTPDSELRGERKSQRLVAATNWVLDSEDGDYESGGSELGSVSVY